MAETLKKLLEMLQLIVVVLMFVGFTETTVPVTNTDLYLQTGGIWAETSCDVSVNSLVDRDPSDDRLFKDCSTNMDGWIEITLKEPRFVEYIRIYTPATSHLRNDYYEMKVCDSGVCESCDPIPQTPGGMWSETKCGAAASRAILTKTAPTQFELSEIELYGYGLPAEIQSIEAETVCHGDVTWIDDNNVNGSWTEYGFGDCSTGTDGMITFLLTEKQLVDYVRIHTPSDGHLRNDYYQLEVCGDSVCSNCEETPASSAGQISLVECKILGDSVVLKKAMPTQIQLVEVDIHGYIPALLIDDIQTDSQCVGSSSQINDNYADYSYSNLGFADCNEALTGWVNITLYGSQFVAYVRIFTAHDGHSRNDYYNLEVCKSGNCTDCEAINQADPGEWSVTKCGIIGDEVRLTKRVETKFQLVEVDVLGYSVPIETTTAATATPCSGFSCTSPGFRDCIPLNYVCDGEYDCGDQSDEPPECQDDCDTLWCKSRSREIEGCFPASWVCDNWDDCEDGSDEANCGDDCDGLWCKLGFRDIEGCYPSSWVCDNWDDCEDGSDEANCDSGAETMASNAPSTREPMLPTTRGDSRGGTGPTATMDSGKISTTTSDVTQGTSYCIVVFLIQFLLICLG